MRASSRLSYRPKSLLFAALLSGIVACDGCEEKGNDPCTTVYKDECGHPCAVDVNCAPGLYCGTDGKCLADCTPDGGQCEAGVECTDRGRCGDSSTGTFSSGQGGGFNSGGNGSGGGCADIAVTFEPTTPTVLLLIDQSGSMTAPFGNGDRWTVLYDTLMDPTVGIVSQLQSSVRFSLALYTGDGGAQCPLLVEVTPPALNNFSAVDAAYAPEAPIGETPTGDSITALLPALVAFAEPGPKAIVLATDGEPDTCRVPNPQMGQAEAIAAAQAAYAAGVELYIISVGDQVGAQHQQDMANAGKGLPLDGSMGNAPYFPATDQAALQTAFETIINGVRSCVLELSGAIDTSKACEGTIFVDGSPIPCDDPNGWTALSPTEIELLGASCDAIQTGTHTVTGSFPCGVVVPE